VSYKPATPEAEAQPGYKNDADMADRLLRMWSFDVSGNCMEMAVMSAYFAMRNYHAQASELRKGVIKKPGDHAFCLIGVPGNADAYDDEYDTVLEFTHSTLARQTLIVDPWLNTVCPASFYVERATIRLEKWHRDCKRIWWKGWGADKPGFYAPLGLTPDGNRRRAWKTSAAVRRAWSGGVAWPGGSTRRCPKSSARGPSASPSLLRDRHAPRPPRPVGGHPRAGPQKRRQPASGSNLFHHRRLL